jgi:hypothetical protein
MSGAPQPNFGPSNISVESLRMRALIESLIKDARTAMPVKVMAVHPGAGSPPTIGTVDVQPLVQTVDGSGKLWPLGVTYGASFSRSQAGANAIVMDPGVGDIGIATVCDRDISSVVASGGLAGPGSARTHDISDLVYQFSIFTAAELQQYIWFAAGINIKSPAVSTSANLSAGTGATGTFTDLTGQVITVQNGIITNIE